MNPSETITTPPAPPRVTFSQELRELAAQFAERPVRLGEILEASQGRGFNLLLLLIALPFLTPIPLPGFSLPFGLVVAVIGARLALGQKPWLPQKLLTHELPPRLFSKLLKAASRVVKWLEFFLRPRLFWMNDHIVFRRVAGALIVAATGMFMSTTGGPVFAFVAICFAALGFKSASSLFWPIPQGYLDVRIAAAVIALINSIGNLGGFVAPTVFGYLEKTTGSVQYGLYGLAAASVLAAGLVFLVRTKPKA